MGSKEHNSVTALIWMLIAIWKWNENIKVPQHYMINESNNM